MTVSLPDRDPDDTPERDDDAQIVAFPGAQDDDPRDDEPGTELIVRPESRLATRLGSIADRPIIAPRDTWAASAKWWARAGWRSGMWSATHAHVLVADELRPIRRGFATTWHAWRDWCTEAEMTDIVAGADTGKAGLAKELARARAGHRRLSAFVGLLAAGGVGALWWFYAWPAVAVLAVTVVGVADLIGRAHPDPDAPPPPVRRTVLAEGAPLGALTQTVIERLQEEGIRVEAADRMTVHPGGEYRLTLAHEDAIERKHLWSLERHIGAARTSIRLIGDPHDAGTSELRMPTRDHLAAMPRRPMVETGSRSITEPAPLWRRADGDLSAPHLAAVHVDLVGTTGAGKSEAVQEFISFFGECHDVYPVFIDLTKGPVGALNRSVLRRRAFDHASALELLQWAQEEVDKRHDLLHELAESDDPDAPVEWDLAWGPQIEIIIDEYSFVAAHDDLHGLVEAIMRIGRKVKVCVVRASQRSGVKDLGSTIAAALVGLKILMACTERDTTSMLSTEHRDLGWSPHLLRPAVKGDPRDAGKCYVWGPGHRDPEIHRFHTPNEPGETKRRDRIRGADGLPELEGATPDALAIEALTLDDVQVAVGEIFEAHDAGWLTTEEILAELAERGHALTAKVLGPRLGNVGSRREVAGQMRRGYALADVHAAWEHEARERRRAGD